MDKKMNKKLNKQKGNKKISNQKKKAHKEESFSEDFKENVKTSSKKQRNKSENEVNIIEEKNKVAPTKYNDEKLKKKEAPKNNRSTNIANTSNNKNLNKKNNAVKSKKQGGCFLCFCCSCNDAENELISELIVENELEENARLKKIKDEEAAEENRLREENEKQKVKDEEAEEENRLRDENEKQRMKEEEDRLREENERKRRSTVLIHKDAKAKLFVKKKAVLNFKGAAAAPSPPDISACVGEPPQVKETSVPLGKGAYLIYNSDMNGQLEIHYSRVAIKGSGVLAHISSQTIPEFYFDGLKKKEIILTNVSNKMQSEFVNDLKQYYECFIKFMKLKKNFNGVLYFLPACGSQPPPMLDMLFYNIKEKSLTRVPLEEAVEFLGDYLFIIQAGLEIFKGPLDTEKLYSYVKSYGAVMESF